MNRTAYCLTAIAGLLAFTSCSSEMPEDISTNSDNVEFRIEIPTALGSRAGFYGDGVMADINIIKYSLFRIYDQGTDDERMECVSNGEKTVTSVQYGIDAVHLNLLKGYTYMVTFCACNSEKNKFFSYLNGIIDVNYSENVANNKNNDVFVGHSKVFTVSEGYSEIVTLSRPFAQLNWGVSDLGDPSLAQYLEEMTAQVKISGGVLYKKYNIAKERLEEPVEKETSFPLYYVSGCPSIKDVEFPVKNDAKSYQLLNMHYMLVDDEGDTAAVELQLKGCPKEIDIKVDNAPLLPNHRTNIYGDLFTAPTQVKMSVVSSYSNDTDDPDNHKNIEI